MDQEEASWGSALLDKVVWKWACNVLLNSLASVGDSNRLPSLILNFSGNEGGRHKGQFFPKYADENSIINA
jgi:hypothetical protein